MFALSVRQPWAWLIVHGYKDVENRTWVCPRFVIRRRVLIHAGKRFDRDGYLWVKTHFPKIPMPTIENFEVQGIVGSVVIDSCVNESPSPWFEGRWGLVLKDPLTSQFQHCLGKLGFFHPVIGYE